MAKNCRDLSLTVEWIVLLQSPPTVETLPSLTSSCDCISRVHICCVFSLVLLNNCIISLLVLSIWQNAAENTHRHARVHIHTHAPITRSIYTLTVNLQPVAQLDSVAMANILPPESSAKTGAREVKGESDFEHVTKCKGRAKGKIEKSNEGEERERKRGRAVIRCMLLDVT